MMQRVLQGVLTLRLLCGIVLGATVLGGAALAQTLDVSPWPPTNARSALSGQGFKPNTPVALAFNPPAPTGTDGAPAPRRVTTDASGAFRLELVFGAPSLGVTATSGALSASLRRDPPVLEYVIDGTTVVAKELDRVVARYYLSGPVKTLERTLGGERATVRHANGLEELFNIEGGKVLERVTYPASPELLRSLEAPTVLKTALTDPVTHWRSLSERDPTNPLLKLEWGRALRAAGDASAASVWQGAVDTPAPFYVSTRLAARFETLKQPELAQAALERAKRAFYAAGYDPGFPVTKAALAAWGDPLGVARRLFAAQNPSRGGAWLEFVRVTTPRFPGYGVVYQEYASFLEGQTRSSEALDWRNFVNELNAGTPFTLGDQGYARLEVLGLLALGLCVFCFLALQFVLLLKYYPQQTRDLKPFGGRLAATSAAPLVRLRHNLSAYQTITEKLIGILLLVGAIAGLGLWQYAGRAKSFLETPGLAQGTAGGASYYQALSAIPAPGSAYLTGLGAQLDGDPNRALESYREASSLAAAANNSATIRKARGDEPGAAADLARASALEPNNLVTQYNLGNTVSGYRIAAQETYRKGQPLLETYTPRELAEYRFGPLEAEYLRMVSDPWGYLMALPLGLPEWARGVFAVLVLAVVIGAVLWVLVPRVRGAATAPRSPLYHLGALLVPGSGLADEVWGIILLLPAATIALLLGLDYFFPDRLESLFAVQRFLGIGNVGAFYSVNANLQWLWLGLAAIYVVNFLGWLLETLSVSRRARLRAAASATPAAAPPPRTP